MPAAERLPDIKKLLGPAGRCLGLEKPNSVLVMDRVGNVRRILEHLKPKPAEPKFTVEFRAVPWADVLDWYARTAALPFVGDVKPTGTVTLTPGKTKQYTLGEVTDLLNELLVQQKFLLVRRDKSFRIISTDEKIDPFLFRRVELAELPKLGKSELVEVVVPLPKLLPVKEHEAELKKMLGPLGQLLGTNGKRNAVILRDTAGNILRIQANIAP